MQNPKVDLIVGNLTEVIESGLERAATFYALVAFVRLSGIASLLSTLQKFVQAGGEVKLLTGDYLYVTEPEALEAIWKLGPEVEARLWRSHGRSFHPKAYLFDSDESAEVIVGSSNLSLSGLTSGIEWNLHVTDAQFPEPDPFDAFQQLFYSDATVPINQVTIAAYRKEHASQSVQSTMLWTTEDRDGPFKEPLALAEADDDASHEGPLCSPREAQIEALEALV
ncbi:MAG: phospholipase D-like domain-containing protein, partial [Firmicutes bacterium]|nr:phospholipase D-like domain-containing protein [Bacillota bacterium]